MRRSLQNPAKFLVFVCFQIGLLGIAVEGLAVTKTWAGGTGTGLNWNLAANWSPSGIPVTNDDVVFNTAGTINFSTLPTANIAFNSLTISQGTVTLAGTTRTFTLGGNASTDFTIANGATLVATNVNITLANNATATIAGTYNNGSVRTFNTNNSGVISTVAGTVNNSGTVTCTTATKLLFQSGSTYKHAVNGGTIPKATWDPASNCNVTGMTSTSPSGLAQTFGNFTWNCSSQTGTVATTGSINVKGNFTLTAGKFTLNNATSYTLTIAGNYTQTGGTFDFNAGTSGSGTMNLAGNLTISSGYQTFWTSSSGAPNGNVVFNGTNQQVVNFTNQDAATWVNYTINPGSNVKISSNILLTGQNTTNGTSTVIVNGTLDVDTYTITDSGNFSSPGSKFTLNSGATLITANTGGIDGSIPSANTTKTFSTGANYIYDGTAAQITGASLTGANNLTINNAAGVTLSNPTTVSGTLTLTNGILTTTTSNLLSVSNTDTNAISGGTTTSFINGPVTWSLASGSSYTFPVGEGSTVLPFGLNVISGSSPQITVEAFAGNAGGSATSPLESLSTTEYWLASVAGGTYSGGSVSLTRQSALSGLDAIGRSSTLSGAYSSLNGTVSGTSIIGSDNTGNTLGYFVMAAKRSITTGAIAGSPFCPGSSVSVPYTISGTFNSGNTFIAQLSDAAGSFNSPTNIGTLTATTSGIITAAIPAGQAAGSGYRIRVVSDSPSVTGSDNGTNLTVNSLPSAAGTITGTSSVLQGQTGVSYTVQAITGATSYVWSYSGAGVTINGTGNSITIDFSSSATSGNLTVYGTNSCGNGSVSAAFPISVTSSVSSFWYKADQGTSTTIDNSGITSWADQSGQSNDATSRNTAPAFKVSGWNFNPKVNFSSGYFLTAKNGISDDMTFFAVYNSTQNTGSSSFWLTPAIIGGETSSVQNDYTLSTNSGRLYFKGTTGDNFGAQTTGTYNDGKVRIVSVTRQKSATGTIYLYVNGEQAATAGSDNTSLTGPTQLGIGNHFSYQASAQFIGDLSEVYGINSVFSSATRKGFESYLAVKYGITLGTTASPADYFNAAGTTIWAGNSTYQNDVHGIGRDDVYGLDQRSSKSENPGTDVLTIQSGSTYSNPLNAQTGTALSDRQFLLTGHNNGSTTTVSALSTGINAIGRKWYAQVTNSLPTESFQFDLTGTSFGTYCKIGLLIADDENLSTNQRFVEGTLGSSTLTVNHAAITGNKYFTVAALVAPTAGAIASDQTICSGDIPAPITSTTDGTGFGTISYLWESSPDGSSWNSLSGVINSTCSPGALTETTYFRRKTVATVGSVSCISGETNVIAITVQPNLSVVALTPATAQTICAAGTGTQLAVTETGGGTINARQWGKSSVSGGTVTAISGATGNTYTPIASDLGTGTWYVVCTSIPACGTATVSNEVTVKVYSPFTAGSISTTGETVCYGGDPGTIGSLADASGGDNVITYKWQANGVDIVSANSATYDPPAGLATTTIYTRWAKDNTCNTTFTQSAGSWKVTVNPQTTVDSQSTAGQTQCLNGTFSSISVTASGTGTLSYQWYSNTSSSTTGGTSLGAANGAQTSSYTPQAASAGTLYYYCVVTGSCGSASSAVSGAFVVNVLPTPIFIVAPGSQECQNDDVVYTTQSGQSNYVWSVPGTAGVDYSITSGGIGANNYTVTLKWLTTGNKTVTVNYDNSSGCSGMAAASSTITVNPVPSPGNITTD